MDDKVNISLLIYQTLTVASLGAKANDFVPIYSMLNVAYLSDKANVCLLIYYPFRLKSKWGNTIWSMVWKSLIKCYFMIQVSKFLRYQTNSTEITQNTSNYKNVMPIMLDWMTN